jgi:serine/threonine-protein kinase
MNDELVGKTIGGRYRVLDLFGVGGMSNVYRAVELGGDERAVAIKALNPRALGDPTCVRRFERELEVIKRLRHENVIELIDAVRENENRLYLVTELLDGITLASVLAKGPISTAQTMWIAEGVTSALIAAHAQGVIHRDLTPENIFISVDGGREQVKVIDFGLAKVIDQPKVSRPRSICGTPGYIAPEAFQGSGEVDARADLYSLGVVLHFCLSGRHPFGTGEPAQLFERQKEKPPSIDAPWAVPARFASLISRMLAPLPADRPASASELLLALDEMTPELATWEGFTTGSPAPEQSAGWSTTPTSEDETVESPELSKPDLFASLPPKTSSAASRPAPSAIEPRFELADADRQFSIVGLGYDVERRLRFERRAAFAVTVFGAMVALAAIIAWWLYRS